MTEQIGRPISPRDPTSDRALEAVRQGVTSAVSEGWVAGGSFFGSIMAGTVLGWMADRWMDTDPWLLVAGVTAGAYTGFHRMWRIGRKPTGKQPVDVI